MDDMGIAALSVGLHQAQTQQQMGVSVLKMAMDSSSQGVEEVLEQLGDSLDPAVGQSLDIMA
jgi:hypothetical protein